MNGYWYKLYDANTRINYILEGATPEPIKLYPETQEILKSFQEPTNPEGWGRLGMDDVFESVEEAETVFYKRESDFIESVRKMRKSREVGA